MKLIETNEHDLIFGMSAGQKTTLSVCSASIPCFPKNSRPSAAPETMRNWRPNRSCSKKPSRNAATRTVDTSATSCVSREDSEVTEEEIRLRLRRNRVNWLLEVLNEIRVGHWHQLGSPDIDETVLTPENIEQYISMQLCAEFQMVLLDALNGPEE